MAALAKVRDKEKRLKGPSNKEKKMMNALIVPATAPAAPVQVDCRALMTLAGSGNFNQGRDDVVECRRLIALGVDVNASFGGLDGAVGSTALMTAAANGHANIVRELIRAGAAVDLRNEQQCTALHLAAYYGAINRHSGFTGYDLHSYVEIIRELAAAGAALEAVNE